MAEYTHGKILPIDIEEEMKQSYIDYAMSVIVNRALPDVRDGLKPVHRRILYAMREGGNTPDRPFKKAARTVGDVLGKYHPHGDAAVYDALVRMAQDFSMRYPLVEGHGNFGSIDGDPPAAMRYTEARLSPLAMELMRDLDRDTVDFVPNFDETEREPAVLPARFPNLLVNGAAGIAVGMATNIPPHNLCEAIDGVIALIDRPDIKDRDLLKVVKGPDFPTGGVIVGHEGIRQAYLTGRGVITIRAHAQIENLPNGKARIVVTEIPYEVSKAKIIEKIAELVHERRIEGLTDLRDETDRSGLRVVIEVGRGANAHVVLNQLYKFTPLQVSYGIILLALVDGQPRVLTLRQLLHHYLEHQKDVVIRRTRHDLAKAEARAHILEGLRIALDHIDAVITLIRQSRTVDEARNGLMTQFQLSEKQAQAILDMRLQRLTGLEREKVEEEYQAVRKEIEYLRAVLGSEKMVLDIVKRELTEIRDRFGDARRTKIVAGAADFQVEDLIAAEDVVITLTHQGYIKRLPVDTYRSQRRGGRGVAGINTRDEDFVSQLFIATTHDSLLFFTNKGKVYHRKVYEVPEGGRTARGTALVNLIEIQRDEQVTAVIPVGSFEQGGDLLMCTREGLVKRTALSEFAHIRRGGLIALFLEEGDELVAVELTTGTGDVLLVTQRGQAIRFPVAEVRTMGRSARGVIGIRLDEGDHVVGMQVVAQEDADLLVVTERGFGKRTRLQEFRGQGRGGKGIRAITVSARNGMVAGFALVRPGEEVVLVSQGGIILRVPVDQVSVQGRAAQGVTLMRLEPGDRLAGVATLPQRSQ